MKAALIAVLLLGWAFCMWRGVNVALALAEFGQQPTGDER